MSEETGVAAAVTGSAVKVETALQGEAAATPTAPIPAAPVCDQALLNELYFHVKALGCLNTFDHTCSEILQYANGKMLKAAAVTAGAAGFTTLAVGPYHEMATKRATTALDTLRRGQEIKPDKDARFMRRYSELLKLEDDGKLPQFARRMRLNPDEARVVLLKHLEKYSTGKTLERAVLARKAMQKAILSQTLKRGAGYVAMGAGFLSGVGSVLAFCFDTTPAGDCNDNGMAFIDYKPREDGGQGCELSFNLTGSKVRYFFEQSTEKQLKILKRDPTTCQYYHLMNENLKGHLMTEIQNLNEVEFETMPKCEKEKPTLLTYDVTIGKRPVRVTAKTDSETKKIRTITTSNLNSEDEETGVKSIFKFQEDSSGSQPYEVERYIYNRKKVDSFDDFLAGAPGSTVVAENMQNLNISQFWTPIIQGCCDGNEPDKCLHSKLPGLKEVEAPASADSAVKKGSPASSTNGQK